MSPNCRYDPSPVMRGLVACVGSDYCHFAPDRDQGLGDRGGPRTGAAAGPASKMCRSPFTGRDAPPVAACTRPRRSACKAAGRVDGKVVDAAHVFVNGRSGPTPASAKTSCTTCHATGCPTCSKGWSMSGSDGAAHDGAPPICHS